MGKGLEALKDLREVKGWNNDEFERRLTIIEKELKALEIIKKYYLPVNCEYDEYEIFKYYLKDTQYVSSRSYKLMSKEEYDLLKEVLL